MSKKKKIAYGFGKRMAALFLSMLMIFASLTVGENFSGDAETVQAISTAAGHSGKGNYVSFTVNGYKAVYTNNKWERSSSVTVTISPQLNLQENRICWYTDQDCCIEGNYYTQALNSRKYIAENIIYGNDSVYGHVYDTFFDITYDLIQESVTINGEVADQRSKAVNTKTNQTTYSDLTAPEHEGYELRIVESHGMEYWYYDPIEYTIAYDNDGGIGGDGPDHYTIESAEIKPTEDPQKAGYAFAGWTPASIPAGSTGNKTFTASWRAENYTLTLGEYGERTCTYDMPIGELPDTEEREGYMFYGWYSPELGGELTADSIYTYPGNAAAYPHYEANIHYITFDSGYGSSCERKIVAYDDSYGSLPTPEREGYTFLGWYWNGMKINESDRVDSDEPQTFKAEWTFAGYDESTKTLIISDTYADTLENICREAYKDTENIVIGDKADPAKIDFSRFTALKTIQTKNSDRYTTYDGVLYSKDEKNLIYCPAAHGEPVKISPKCSVILSNAFQDSKTISGLILPFTLTEIQKDAFAYSAISEITIKNPQTIIADEEGTIPSTVRQVNCFYGSTAESYCLKYHIHANLYTEIPDYFFKNETSMTNFVIPDNITRIGTEAFAGSCLEEITIPRSVEVIGERAFADNDHLKKIIIENPNCRLPESEGLVSGNTVIAGYTGSTADDYSQKYQGRPCESTGICKKIVLKTDEGTIISSSNIPTDEGLGNVAVPKKENYVFVGYFDERTGEPYYDENGCGVAELSDSDPDSTHVLIARWRHCAYTVNYHPNGADNAENLMKADVFDTGTEAALSANTYVRRGYIFAGWGREHDSADIVFSDGQRIKDLAGDGESVELFAIWKQKEKLLYTVNQYVQEADGSYQTTSREMTTDQDSVTTWTPGVDFVISEGYHLNEEKSGIIKNESGQTVMNIYLDRNRAGLVYDLNAEDAQIAEMPEVLAPWGSVVSLNAPIPERNGFRFVGWSLEAGDQTPVEQVVLGKDGTRVYAIWEEIKESGGESQGFGEGDPEEKPSVEENPESGGENTESGEENTESGGESQESGGESQGFGEGDPEEKPSVEENTESGEENTESGGESQGSGEGSQGSGEGDPEEKPSAEENPESGGENPESGKEPQGSGEESQGSVEENTESVGENPESGKENTESGGENPESGEEPQGSGEESQGSVEENTESVGENPESGKENTESGGENPESGKEPQGSGGESQGSGEGDPEEKPSGGENPESGKENTESVGENPESVEESQGSVEEPQGSGGENKEPGGESTKPGGETSTEGGEKNPGEEPQGSGEEPNESGEENQESGKEPQGSVEENQESGKESQGSGEEPNESGEENTNSGPSHLPKKEETEKDSGEQTAKAGEKTAQTDRQSKKDAGEKTTKVSVKKKKGIKKVRYKNVIYKISKKKAIAYKAAKKSIRKVVIPGKIRFNGKKYTVVRIRKNAFRGCKKLKKAVIRANKIKCIGKNAFRGCKKLKKVFIKAGKLKKIGARAFYGDKNLEKVVIHSQRRLKIGKKAFGKTKITA